MSKSTVDQPWASAMGLGLRAAGFRHSGSKRPANDRRLKVWGNLNQWLGRGFGLISHLIRFIQVSGPRGQKVASIVWVSSRRLGLPRHRTYQQK